MLRLVFSLAVAVWLGGVVCLSFVVAPAAHGTFPSPEARRFLRPVFPRYYRLGYLCGSIALAAVLLGRAALSQEEIARLALPVAFALVAGLVGGEILLPRLQASSGEQESFARLHQLSAMLNTATLAALALALAGAVLR
jgi:uncharacterized membrane protein